MISWSKKNQYKKNYLPIAETTSVHNSDCYAFAGLN